MGLNIQLTVEGKDATRVGDLLDQGERLEANLKAHVHREARPNTHPDLLALAQEQARFMSATNALVQKMLGGDPGPTPVNRPAPMASRDPIDNLLHWEPRPNSEDNGALELAAEVLEGVAPKLGQLLPEMTLEHGYPSMDAWAFAGDASQVAFPGGDDDERRHRFKEAFAAGYNAARLALSAGGILDTSPTSRSIDAYLITVSPIASLPVLLPETMPSIMRVARATSLTDSDIQAHIWAISAGICVSTIQNIALDDNSQTANVREDEETGSSRPVDRGFDSDPTASSTTGMRWRTEPLRAEGTASASIVDAAMDRLASALPLDEHHVREGHEIGWFAYRHPHSFRFSASEDGVRIISRVPVVRQIDEGSVPPDMAADMFNKHVSLSALIHNTSGSLDLMSVGTFDDESLNSKAFDIFVLAAVLANWEANARAEGLAAMVGGRPAWAVHPELGRRRDGPHPALQELERVPQEGQQANRYDADVLGALANSAMLPWAESQTFPGGIRGEFAAGDRVASTTVVGIDHPTYGAGALLLTQIPFNPPADPIEFSATCNMAEVVGDTGHPMYGAWTPDPDGDPILSHATFVPNYAASLSPLPYLAAMDYLRTQWFAERFL